MVTLSATEVQGSSDFKSHFRENYEEKLKGYLRWKGRSLQFGKLFLISILASFIVPILISPTLIFPHLAFLYWSAAISLFVLLLLSIILIFFSAWKMSSLGVEDREILVYYLLEASKFYDGFLAEEDERRKQIFIDKCLVEVEKFGGTFKNILDNSKMTLKLPDIVQLESLYENMMNYVYPAIRERKKNPSMQDGRDFSGVMVSLARLFFYEKAYGELPIINEKFSRELKDSYEPYSPKKERRQTLRGRVLKSFRLMAVFSLLVISGLTLLIIYLFRASQYGVENYLAYISDNAAAISIGIIVAWVTLLYILRQSFETKK